MGLNSDAYETLVSELATESKLTLADARRLTASTGPLVIQWETEARAAEAAGDTALAAKRRMSEKHVKDAVILDVALHLVVAVDKVEQAVLTAFDRALERLA